MSKAAVPSPDTPGASDSPELYEHDHARGGQSLAAIVWTVACGVVADPPRSALLQIPGHLSVPGNMFGLLLIPDHVGGDWTFIAATRGAEGAIEMQEPLMASFTHPADRGATRDLTQGPFAGARPLCVPE